MAEYAYFYDSENGDRTYNADSFSNWLGKFFRTGVFQNELQVTSTTGMNIMVGSGYACIDGKTKIFGDTQFTIAPASSTLPRIDTVVVERNDIDRDFTLKLITGEYSGETPQPTAPVRDGGIYQIVLAQIYVEAGIVSIYQTDITDTRPDDDLCGWVVGTVDRIDLSQILEQSTIAFNEWFETIRGILDEETAGHLQNEIDAINGKIAIHVIDVTLVSRNWSNNQYVITNSLLGGTEKVKELTYPVLTQTQREALTDANIDFVSEGNGTITLEAFGGAPSIDVPIRIVVNAGEVG